MVRPPLRGVAQRSGVRAGVRTVRNAFVAAYGLQEEALVSGESVIGSCDSRATCSDGSAGVIERYGVWRHTLRIGKPYWRCVARGPEL